MFPFKHWKTLLWVMAALLALYIFGNFYALFFRPSYIGANGGIMPVLIAGLALGGVLMYLLLRMNAQSKKYITESSHTVVESVRKVFKIVCAEGQFNELYNYEETKKLLGILPSTKKAIVIVKAKVLVGFNFEKMKWEADETQKRIKIIDFPQAEILSIETDYKYYNMEENIFDMFSRDDLSKIQQNGKKQVEIAALNSDLSNMAAEQMRTLLPEILKTNKWTLEDSSKITAERKNITTA